MAARLAPDTLRPSPALPPPPQDVTLAEALFKGVLETVGDGVLVADRRGIIQDANNAVERLFGWSREEVIGRPLSMLMPPEEAAGHQRYIDGYLATGRSRIIGRGRETLALHRDGRTIPIELAIGDLSGLGAPRFVGIIRDITERKRAQAELQDSERRFRDYAEACSDWFWESDQRHRFTAFAGNFQRTAHFDPDAAIGRTRFELMSSNATVDLVAGHAADLAARRAFRDFIYPLEQFPGHVRLLRINGRPVQGPDGRFLGYRGTASDITDTVEAQQRVAALESQLSTAISSISEGFVLYDEQDCMVTCNTLYRTYFQTMADLLVPGTSFRSIAAEGIRRGHYRLPEGQPAQEYLAWRIDRHRNHLGEPTLLDLADGRVLRAIERRTPDGGIVGIHSDVTEQLRLQRQITAARDVAEAASRAKSEFLAVMSHEIRTPMNGVIGMTGLLLDTSLDPEQHHFATIIRDSAESLLSIINDILDFSKVEAGRLELARAAFDPVTLVDSVAEILAPRAKDKGVELTCLVDPSARYLLSGDAGRVRQVLMNLAGNAVKFTDRGWVGIDVRCTGRTGERCVLRFEVADSGIGIPAEAQDRLFGMFTQVDNSATRRHGGTGLGLAISRRLVEMMEGRIGFTSRVGEGSTFWFELPLTIAGPLSAPAPDLTGLRILVADPLAPGRAVLCRRVEAAGARVVAAADEDGVAAQLLLAASSGIPFHAVLLDEAIGPRYGLDLAARLRALPILSGVRLLLASTRGMDRLGPESVALLDAVLLKPVRDGALLSTIARLLDRLPEEEPPAVPVPAPPDRPGSGGARSLRVLVAEDNPVNQEVTLGHLRRLGHVADTVTDGLAAVEAVRRGPYDLVLMDVRMPVLDGLGATRRIRALPGAVGRIPIIAMTASAMRADEDACRDAGMDGYVPKPVDRDRLVAMLAPYAGNAPGEGPPAAGPDADAGAGPQEAGAAPAGPGVSPAVFRELCDTLGEAEVAAIVRRFFRDSRVRLDLLRSAMANRRAGIARQEAHAIKGAAGTLGLPAVERAAERLEQQLDLAGDDVPLPDGLLVPLTSALARAHQDYAARLTADPPAADGVA